MEVKPSMDTETAEAVGTLRIDIRRLDASVRDFATSLNCDIENSADSLRADINGRDSSLRADIERRGTLLRADIEPEMKSLPAPLRLDGATVTGDGWTVSVAPGWVVRSGPRPGDYQVVRQDR